MLHIFHYNLYIVPRHCTAYEAWVYVYNTSCNLRHTLWATSIFRFGVCCCFIDIVACIIEHFIAKKDNRETLSACCHFQMHFGSKNHVCSTPYHTMDVYRAALFLPPHFQLHFPLSFSPSISSLHSAVVASALLAGSVLAYVWWSCWRAQPLRDSVNWTFRVLSSECMYIYACIVKSLAWYDEWRVDASCCQGSLLLAEFCSVSMQLTSPVIRWQCLARQQVAFHIPAMTYGQWTTITVIFLAIRTTSSVYSNHRCLQKWV